LSDHVVIAAVSPESAVTSATTVTVGPLAAVFSASIFDGRSGVVGDSGGSGVGE
jgi:hypothetical protein